MEELIYFCVRIVCIGYLLYSVYGWRKHIEIICTLFYGKPCVKKVHIPADTRSAFPVISVQSPV
ncbi:DUF4122 family protein, partial [Phocaeicola coprophilus]